jgi:Tfp pilus assembly pilus retraction ATPase PilT
MGEPQVNKLFRLAKKHGASELYLRVGYAPMLRLHGDIRRTEIRPLTREDMECLLYPIMSDQLKQEVDRMETADFLHTVGEEQCRFACRVSRRQDELGLYARLLEGT